LRKCTRILVRYIHSPLFFLSQLQNDSHPNAPPSCRENKRHLPVSAAHKARGRSFSHLSVPAALLARFATLTEQLSRIHSELRILKLPSFTSSLVTSQPERQFNKPRPGSPPHWQPQFSLCTLNTQEPATRWSSSAHPYSSQAPPVGPESAKRCFIHTM
jgi:hypothetical protein